MSALAQFIEQLLYEGRAVLRERPGRAVRGEPDAAEVLRATYAQYRLSVAGQLIEYDPSAALAAAELVYWACWYLLRRDETLNELKKNVSMCGPPTTPAQHLSADLVLRFVPQLHRRARALAPTDELALSLAMVLRAWPLTGVLSEVEEGPTTPLDFGDHPGLVLLYAERLAQHEKSAWFPQGRTLEYVEMVFSSLGRGESARLQATRAALAGEGDVR
jgi:hypothetical protein